MTKRQELHSAQKAGIAAVSLLAVGGQGLGYLMSILLARNLSIPAFEAYVVASAVFIVLVTLAPQGLEKYALRIVPVLVERADWRGLRSYLVHGIRRTLLGALLAAIAALIWAFHARALPADVRGAVLIGCIALPAGALVHLGLEVLTALGHPVAAAAIVRIGVPAIALLGLAIALDRSSPISGTTALACWAVGWLLALGGIAAKVWRVAPPELRRTKALLDAQDWSREARPFWIYRVLLAVLGQAGVMSLELWQQGSAVAVGAYAVAVTTAGLAQVLATATNRIYASRLSILLERGDRDRIHALRWARLRWLAAPLSVYLVVVFVFSREILAFFRPEFVDEGLVPLRLLAVLSTMSILLAMAPTYLKFLRRTGALYTSVAIAAALQLVLLVAMVPQMGATGAALASSVAMGFMYVRLARLAHRELASLRVD